MRQRWTFLRRHWENSKRSRRVSTEGGRREVRLQRAEGPGGAAPHGPGRDFRTWGGGRKKRLARSERGTVIIQSAACLWCVVGAESRPRCSLPFTAASGKRNATNGSNEWDRKAPFLSVRRWSSERAGERSPVRGDGPVGGLVGFGDWGCVVSRENRGSGEDNSGLFPLSAPLSFLFTHLYRVGLPPLLLVWQLRLAKPRTLSRLGWKGLPHPGGVRRGGRRLSYS